MAAALQTVVVYNRDVGIESLKKLNLLKSKEQWENI